MKRYNILHIISGLSVGGAEMMLVKLLANKGYKDKFKITVVSLRATGELSSCLKNIGIDVKCLNFGEGFYKNIFSMYELIRIIKTLKPDLIQTWLYHADFIGGIVGYIFNTAPIIWGIHNSYLDRTAKLSTKWILKICVKLSSKVPYKIISCSECAKNIHLNIGYCDKFEYIPNGFDINVLRPDLKARKKIRAELSIQENEVVFGLIARFDPLKDHNNFLEAAKRVSKKNKGCKFLLCGKDINWRNDQLVDAIKKVNLENKIYLLDKREDIPQIMNAIDFCVVSSKSEAFPMVLGESMAVGTPCITTNVGDAKKIINGIGFCVEAENSLELADAMLRACDLSKTELSILCKKAREHIFNNYSMDIVADKYSRFHSLCIKDFNKN